MRITRTAAALLVLGAAMHAPHALLPDFSAADHPVSAHRTATAHGTLWEPPLGSPLRVAAAYSLPDGPYRAGHRGIDLPASPGDTVHSPAGGVVSFVGTVVDRPVVSVRVDARTVVSLEPVESGVQAGDAVQRGAVLGTVASGGHCAADCLHLGVRVDGAYVNPMRFLRPRPVLLPW